MKLFKNLFNLLLILGSIISITIVYGLIFNINEAFNIIVILTIIFFLDVIAILFIISKDLYKTN